MNYSFRELVEDMLCVIAGIVGFICAYWYFMHTNMLSDIDLLNEIIKYGSTIILSIGAGFVCSYDMARLLPASKKVRK